MGNASLGCIQTRSVAPFPVSTTMTNAGMAKTNRTNRTNGRHAGLGQYALRVRGAGGAAVEGVRMFVV